MFNAIKTKAKIAKLITTMGVPITITTASGGKIKTNAIFAAEKKTSEPSDNIALSSPLTIGSAVCYITATTKAPSVGDELVGNNRSYNITDVEGYRPASTVIAYKLTME